mgnify:CR=1 FL=1
MCSSDLGDRRVGGDGHLAGEDHLVELAGADARRLGVRMETPAGSGSRLRTAGGMTEARSATIEQMDIAGRKLSNIKVAVIDNGLPVSLLGQNALAELGTITLGNGRMTID